MRAVYVANPHRPLPQGVLPNEVETVTAERPSDKLRLAREAVKAGAERLLVAGGDGSAQGVLPALAGSATILGLIPRGTGNDLASDLGLPLDLEEAARIALNGKPRSIDLLEIASGRESDLAAVGLSVGAATRVQGRLDVLRRRHRLVARLLGRGGFVCTALAEALRPAPIEVEIDWGEGRWSGEILGLMLFVRSRFGGGFPAPRLGWADDGHMKGVILPAQPSLWRRLRAVGRLRRGLIEEAGAEVFRSRRVRIRSEELLQLGLDGELRRRRDPEIRVRPRALRVAVGSRGNLSKEPLNGPRERSNGP